MIDGSWSDDWSQVRTHILFNFSDNDIADNNAYLGRIKKSYFQILLDHINAYVLKVD